MPVVVTLTVILASGSQVILAVNATGVAQLGYTSVLRIGEIHGVLVMISSYLPMLGVPVKVA